MPILDRLLYDSGIDTEGFRAGSAEIKKQLNELGSVATKTFEQDFGRALAKSIDPNNLRQGLDQSRKLLNQFGDDARKSFERTFQREGAKRLFQPFVDETKTFSGQIKAQLRDAFNLKNIALGTAAGFLGAGAITGIIRGLFDIGKATTQLAADAAETRSKFNVVFGDLADETRAFANTFSDSVGRARIDTEEFLSSFQGLLEPMGLTNREAADFSKTLTKLAVDVASFNNKLDADVVRDFQSALVGETEPVKKYGIVLNETRLKQEALNQGLITAGQALTDQQKLHLRYQILLKDTVAAQGDAIRTSDSLVNQQKALAANFKNLGETIGAAVVPGINSVVTAINNLLSSATDTEKLITDLQKLGVAADEIDFLNVIAQTERAQKSIDDLSSEIEVLTSDVTFLGAGFATINPKTLLERLIGNAQTVRDVALGFVEIAEQADGLNTLQEEIGKSTQKILDLTKQLVEVRAGRAGGDAEQIRKEIDLERERVKIAGQVLQFKQAIAAQEKIITENNQQQTDTVLDGVTVEAKRLTVAEQTTTELKAMLAANQGNRKEIEKELAAREKTAKFIEDIRKQLELIAEQDDIGRKLTQIRQEADERRKLYADSAEAIKLINRLEREERNKTLDEFQRKLEEQTRQRIREIVNIELEPRLITTLPPSNLGIDEQKAKTIGERINKILNETLVESPASILLNKISDLGPLLDDEFINFVGIIDKGLADVLAGIAQFAANITSGNILGAITGAVGLLGGLFGGGDSARKRAEAERNQQKAQEEAARAAEKAAEALENLRRAAEAFSAGKLIEEIGRLDDEFQAITNATRKLTQEEIERAVALLEQANTIRDNIALIRLAIEAAIQEGRDTTELDRQLRELELQLEPVTAAIAELGINLSEVTPLEIDRLKVLLQERGVLDDVIKRFQAFGDNLRGILDKLQLGFELLDTTDPAKKLEELLKALTETFAFAVPAQFKDLREFILAGFEAIKNGGQSLIDFLIAAGLEELTAEEFAELLRTLNEFSKGVETVGGELADALADLLDKLQLQFNLLDVNDPVEQLRRLRQSLIDTFGATLPESTEHLQQFIERGVAAFLAGGKELENFLKQFDLEELTAEQFRALLENLEGLLDGIERRFSALTNKLNIEFDLLKIDDVAEKLKRLREVVLAEFQALLPEAGEELEKFIRDGANALIAGGQALADFLATSGLEELTAEELEALLRMLRDLQDGLAETGGAVEKATEVFAKFLRGFGFIVDILDIDDPAEKLRLFRNAVNTTFGADIPESFEAMKEFILNGFIALQGDAEALKVFLASLGLEELTAAEFEDLLRELESGLDAMGSQFKQLVDRLNLQFNLLDIDDPIAKLEKLRKEIKNQFGAIIPDTQEGIDKLIKEGVAALLAGGDALKAFLKSVDLEELTAEQFQDFLEFLKGIADEAKKAAGEIGGEENIGVSVVKSVTFQQENVMLNELATIREILTQMLDIFRLSAPGTANEPLFTDRRLIEELAGISDESSKTNLQLQALNAEIEIVRDILRQTLEFAEEERAIDISTTSPDRLMVNRLNDILAESLNTNAILTEGFADVIAAINGTGGNFNAARFDGDLAQVASGLTGRAVAQNNIYIVKGDTVTQVGIGELEEVDRRLIEKSIIRSRARGVV